MQIFFKKHTIFFLFLFLGIFFRLYNLNWGAPFYFHPDERQNIAYPVAESKSLFMLDQQNFDTGTFPLILIKLVYSFLQNFHLDIDNTALILIISRIFSALISLAILVLLFFITKKIFSEAKAYLAVAFAALSVGFIQFSHFGTIELWEALFFLVLFYYSWRIAKYADIQDAIISGILLGLATATKVLSLILTPTILASSLLFAYHQHLTKQNLLHTIKKLLVIIILFSVCAALSFLITSPQIITNFTEIHRSISFESDVALGKLPVFYTGGFHHTIPVIFQFTKVYPFILNPLITLLFIPSLICILVSGIKKRNYAYLLLATYYLLLSLTQSYFFVKWTRYMIPTLPFVYMILAVAIDDWLHSARKKFGHADLFSYALVTFPLVISFIFAAVFWITVYTNQPTPVLAQSWAQENIPSDAKILTEPFDLGSMPIHHTFPNTIFFNFYELDDPNTTTSKPEQLAAELTTHDYIVLPSQRIFKTRLINKTTFPKGHAFYSQLFNGTLGFEKIYETPCDIFCNINYLGNPVYTYEETANVFDRPTVVIFKKVKSLDENSYRRMLE